ncbi:MULTISPECIES: MarR family winged helix-turn-helix transcriptional regulator [unclassified Streptomyces]|uniref:MarR family winged helix-turn-helix transcriptional regulator n=1 Tax=unclassified Streptomyces TaxID=2593676 RepID=UPI000745F83C|nr:MULTISPECIES: MarR family transcriptional regulator [unclassified Streptomyces]KUL71193.1 MarR family transcriptional regulator [Streptomyces sp. NRRL WC-3604]KUL76891.1 MarR family transcriptional regulator [Streptomyces sp. NRRL WC-3605]
MQDTSHPGPPHPADDVLDHVGYRLKRAHAALRGAMDQALREHDLTVPQYACLEVLAARPGMSNADLARATFVTRQSMNVVLRGLQDQGLLTRPATVETGRARPASLTDEGMRRLTAAQKAVYAIETRMVHAIPDDRLTALLEDLDRIAQSLAD